MTLTWQYLFVTLFMGSVSGFGLITGDSIVTPEPEPETAQLPIATSAPMVAAAGGHQTGPTSLQDLANPPAHIQAALDILRNYVSQQNAPIPATSNTAQSQSTQNSGATLSALGQMPGSSSPQAEPTPEPEVPQNALDVLAQMPASSNNPSQIPASFNNPSQMPGAPTNPSQMLGSATNLAQMPSSSNNPSQMPGSPTNPSQMPGSLSNPSQMAGSPNNFGQMPSSPNSLAQMPSSPNNLAQLLGSPNNRAQIEGYPNNFGQMPSSTNLAQMPGSPNNLAQIFGSSNNLAQMPVSTDNLAQMFGSSNNLAQMLGSSNNLAQMPGSPNIIAQIAASPNIMAQMSGSPDNLAQIHRGTGGSVPSPTPVPAGYVINNMPISNVAAVSQISPVGPNGLQPAKNMAFLELVSQIGEGSEIPLSEIMATMNALKSTQPTANPDPDVQRSATQDPNNHSMHPPNCPMKNANVVSSGQIQPQTGLVLPVDQPASQKQEPSVRQESSPILATPGQGLTNALSPQQGYYPTGQDSNPQRTTVDTNGIQADNFPAQQQSPYFQNGQRQSLATSNPQNMASNFIQGGVLSQNQGSLPMASQSQSQQRQSLAIPNTQNMGSNFIQSGQVPPFPGYPEYMNPQTRSQQRQTLAEANAQNINSNMVQGIPSQQLIPGSRMPGQTNAPSQIDQRFSTNNQDSFQNSQSFSPNSENVQENPMMRSSFSAGTTPDPTMPIFQPIFGGETPKSEQEIQSGTTMNAEKVDTPTDTRQEPMTSANAPNEPASILFDTRADIETYYRTSDGKLIRILNYKKNENPSQSSPTSQVGPEVKTNSVSKPNTVSNSRNPLNKPQRSKPVQRIYTRNPVQSQARNQFIPQRVPSQRFFGGGFSNQRFQRPSNGRMMMSRPNMQNQMTRVPVQRQFFQPNQRQQMPQVVIQRPQGRSQNSPQQDVYRYMAPRNTPNIQSARLNNPYQSGFRTGAPSPMFQRTNVNQQSLATPQQGGNNRGIVSAQGSAGQFPYRQNSVQ